MPERSFRVVIQNSSSFLTLNQTFNHLCGGAWTDGGWTPPGSIGSGASGGMQSESDGFMTGTERYVKYDVDGPDGKHGMIYIYWDNPFYGYTHFRFVTANNDVYPDCDYTPPPGGSEFSGSASLDFTLSMTAFRSGTDSGGDITNVGDLVNYVVGPVSLLGLTGIDDNPELDLQLNDVTSAPPQSFGTASLGPVSLQLLTNATLQQWAGRWANGNVSVEITVSQFGFQLSAVIYDGSTSPPLSFTQTFVPGPAGLLSVGLSSISTLIHSQPLEPAARAAFANAATNVIQEAAKSPNQASAAANRFQSLVAAVNTNSPIINQARARVVGGAIGALVAPQGGVAYLNNHIALWLYGMFQSGYQTGLQMQFQRLGVLGHPISSVMLNQIPHIT